MHLEYLAVRKDLQGREIGQNMLTKVIDKFISTVDTMAIGVLTLVPLNDRLMNFYSERGFTRYAAHLGERRMMMPAGVAMAARDAASSITA